MKIIGIRSLARFLNFTSNGRSFSSLAAASSSSYESIADILQRELGITSAGYAYGDDRATATFSSVHKNMPAKKKAFIEETLAAVNEIVRGIEASKSAKDTPLKTPSEDALNPPQGPARLSSYGIIRLLMSRVSAKNWIELDRDMRNYRIVLRPSEVAWVLKVEKNPHKAWDFFNWASRRPGYRHDSTCFLIMMESLGKCSAFTLIEDLLSEMERLGIPYDSLMLNRLIEIYSSCNDLTKVKSYFQKLRELHEEPSCETYKFMLLAFAKTGDFEKALEMYGLIHKRHEILDVSVYNALFDALITRSDKESIHKAIRLFNMMLEDGIAPDPAICRTVLKLLSEGKQMNRTIELVKFVNEKVSKKEVYENLIKALVEMGYLQDMSALLRKLKDNDIRLSQTTFLDVIDAFCRANKLVEALNIMREMEKDGNYIPRIAYNSVMTVLCDNNQFHAAHDVLKLIKERGPPDDAICNKIVLGLANSGDFEISLSLFEDMYESGCLLNLASFNSLLQTAASQGDFESSRKLLHMMHSKSLVPDVVTYNSAIECFGRAGKLDLALQVFDEMREKGCSLSLSTYNNILLALSQSGLEDAALSFYEEMKVQGFLPDAITFSILSTISENYSDFDERTNLAVVPL